MNSSTEKNDGFGACEFKENLAVLRQIYLFSKLPLETIKIFAYFSTKEVYKSGDLLFEQGEDDGQAFYLISGVARLFRKVRQDEIRVRDLTPGIFVSGVALLGTARRLFSLKAVSDVTCIVFRRDKMSKTLEQFPELIPKVMGGLVERIHEWEEQVLIHHADTDSTCLQETGVSLI